jgi:hypothetical protein
MKKLLYTLLAVSIIFSACKKEDEETNSSNNNNNNSTSILGVWTPTSVTIDTSMITIIDGETVNYLDGEIMTYSGTETTTPAEAGIDGNLEFTDNGLAIFDADDDTSIYSYSNNVVTIINDDGELTEFTCTFTGSDILALTMSYGMDTSYNEPMLIFLGYPEGNISISANQSLTINASRSTVINTNVSQRIGNTNHNWFVKPRFDNILKRVLNKLKK